MIFQKHFEAQTINGVRMGNGIIAFRGIKLNVHVFFVDGVLIDTGAQSLAKFFRPFFHQLDMEQVVITHFHEDHTGCAAYLQNTFHAPIFMNGIMIPYCIEKAEYPMYRQAFWGRRKPFRAQAVQESFQSANGTWKVIQTPGHAIDHLAYLNKETGQLFTGDLYCQEKTKGILREESIPDIIQSLQKVLTYDFEDVFCNHAGYVREGRTALRRKLDYLLDIRGNVIKRYQEGYTPEEIKKQLFPRKYPITFFSAGEWDPIHIIYSILKQHESREIS